MYVLNASLSLYLSSTKSVGSGQEIIRSELYLLVVQDDVRPPHQVTGNPDGVQSIVLVSIPCEVCIVPDLADPQIGRQNLVSLILDNESGCHFIHSTLPSAGHLFFIIGISRTLIYFQFTSESFKKFYLPD